MFIFTSGSKSTCTCSFLVHSPSSFVYRVALMFLTELSATRPWTKEGRLWSSCKLTTTMGRGGWRWTTIWWCTPSLPTCSMLSPANETVRTIVCGFPLGFFFLFFLGMLRVVTKTLKFCEWSTLRSCCIFYKMDKQQLGYRELRRSPSLQAACSYYRI